MTTEKTAKTTRLNKYLALQLGVSRREADEAIEHGLVTVDGEVASLGTQVTPETEITYKGNPVSKLVNYEYILLNKPVGYVCSRRKQGSSPTIYSLLPRKYHTLKTAGRLDRDSSGLLILTNDGDFAHQMTHPSFYKTKIYGVHLDRDLEPLHQQMIADTGIDLEDGISKFQLESIVEGRRDMWRIIMHEGRNRQIRRTFAALGYTVTALHRTQMGNFNIGKIESGKFEEFDLN